MNKIRIFAIFVMLAMPVILSSISPAAANSPNLIVNGSFENPVDYDGGFNTGLPLPTGWEKWPGYKDCYLRGTTSNLDGLVLCKAIRCKNFPGNFAGSCLKRTCDSVSGKM